MLFNLTVHSLALKLAYRLDPKRPTYGCQYAPRQPCWAVHFEQSETSNRQGEKIEELVETHDICDITGHGGSCGV
jgi:hypothetical protein